MLPRHLNLTQQDWGATERFKPTGDDQLTIPQWQRWSGWRGLWSSRLCMSPSPTHATPKLSENCVLAGQMPLKASLVPFATTRLSHLLPPGRNSELALGLPICALGRVGARVTLPVPLQGAQARRAFLGPAGGAALRVPVVPPQVWTTPTSTGEVSPWPTSTAMAKWISSTATGMAPTGSTCR